MCVLTREDIAAHIRHMPDGPERNLALDAFRRKYEGKPKPIDREKYLNNTVLWAEERLGVHLWSKQKAILRSLASNKRTAVKSCYNAGKSYVAAIAACWWIEVHKPGEAFVVTSASSWPQVRAILWREIGRLHAKHNLIGRVNQTEWHITMPAGNEEMVAFGRKPADMDPTAFQGIHAKHVLVLFDEACGIHESLWGPADSLISNTGSKFLAFGNPDDPITEFCEVCKPGSGWNVITISAFDTPNYSGEPVPEEIRDLLLGPEYAKEKEIKWGIKSPSYIARVLGEFPEFTTDGLIPIRWVRQAQERTLIPSLPVELGVDVGGGGNANTIARRNGPVVRVIHNDTNPDTMATLSAALEQIKQSQASSAKVDYIGIGHGAVDRAKEMASDQDVKRKTPQLALNASKIVGVEVGRVASDSEQYVNLRAEGYWLLRERFNPDNKDNASIDIDPLDDDLAAQLSAIRYKRSGGRIQIESKEEMRKRGVSSPDKADAVMLAFLDPPKEEKKSVLTVWGS